MSRVGFWSWIAARAFRGKGITRAGWHRSRSVSGGKRSLKARHAKGQARVNAYEELLQKESEKRREDLQIHIPPGPRLGDVVIEADKVSTGYGDKLLVESMTFALPP